MIVGLPEMKLHLRTDPNSDHDDALIVAYAKAAENVVENWIGRPVYASAADLPAPTAPGYDADQMVADDAVKVAIKMLTDGYYTNRDGRIYTNRAAAGDGEGDGVPPASVRALLSGLKVFAKRPAPRSDLLGDPLP